MYEKNGKFKETAFIVLSSAAMPPAKPPDTGQNTESNRTLVLFSSIPPGAEIQMDGNFVGSTPSSIPAAPGEHSVRITKNGYRPWERTVKTLGGEVTISAELEAVSK
ncbi:MAG: PEGA domain-containing protein [Acidobacteria bacterium]|nr:PEGA domain-containing protein [Acidobacteriota bacterium]